MQTSTRGEIHEVALRDGLQSQPPCLSPRTRLELARLLAATQPTSMEVGSFVHPDKVPQMAGSLELAHMLRDEAWRENIPLFGLVPNQRGFEDFADSGLDGITVLVSASESHSQENVGMGRADALNQAQALITLAKSGGFATKAYISTAFGCPYERDVPSEIVIEISQKFLEWGADKVVLTDTIGSANPAAVASLVGQILTHVEAPRCALHLHDDQGLGVDNAMAGWDLGIRSFDTSLSGIGGCPFAPGAPGNLATETWLAALAKRGEDCQIEEKVWRLAQAGFTKALAEA